MLYTTISEEPPHSSPISSLSPLGMTRYPIASYVTCDRFFEYHKAFVATITTHTIPQIYAESILDER